jgi:hypothetical protein
LKKSRFPLALAAALLMACEGHKHVAPLVRDRPPSPITIFIPVNTPKEVGRYRGTSWERASGFAAKLEAAGFKPTIVSEESEIPPNTPVIHEVRVDLDSNKDGCSVNGALAIISFFTLFVVPDFDCETFGTTFELSRSIDSPSQRVSTQWRVPTIAGWFAIPVGLFAGYAPGRVHDDRVASREIQLLRVAILDALDPQPEP